MAYAADGPRIHFFIDTSANGTGLGAPYRLASLAIGGFAFADVDVSINRADMATSLLGMSVLGQLSSYEVRNGRLYLRR